MSEIKRPALISFNTNKVEDRKAKEIGKTVRISLKLPDPNEDTCPEYSYKEELATAKKREKIKQNAMPPPPTPNGLDPFGDDDDDVRRIAQEMEAKYGVGGPKKKRKGRRDDYADIGMGYDESDSFIDNTDGYDEMIPQNVTTLHGGFYINCGALEFKTDDEASSEVSSSSASSSEDDEEVDGVSKVNGRKRILSSDSEGDRETETELEPAEKKQKVHPANGDVPKLERKKLFGHEKIKEMKKKRAEEKKKSATVKELLKEKRTDTNQVCVPEIPAEKVEKEESKDSMKENKKPVPMDNISDIIELVVLGVEEELRKLPPSVADVKPNNQEKPIVIHDLDCDSSQDVSEEIVKLPENLPNDIVEIVEKIKEFARSSTEGKVKFFTGPVCDILLRLERKCKCLGKQSRVKIYEHLAPFVRCRKETLIKRAKNLMLEDEQKKLKFSLHKLKGDVENIMPMLLETYERESQKVMQRKFSRESLTNEENKQLRLPKRRFAWNDDTRKLVRDIVTLRKKCFLLEGKSKESLDLLMGTFLKTDIQILWPDGWMSMNALQKVCVGLLSTDVKKSSTPTIPTSIPATTELPPTKELQKLSSNSNLSITPIIPTTLKSAITDVITKGDLTINKIDNLDLQSKKSEVKTPSGITITPAVTINPAKSIMEKVDFSKPKHENVILISDTPQRPPKIDVPKLKEEIVKSDTFQIVDLTDQSDRKKKTKKYYEPPKEEIAVSAALNINNLIAESFKTNYTANPDFGKKASDGDEIQKVMEDLRALQKLASPVKQEDSMTGSPVSVIAYNKSFSPKGLSQHAQSSTAQRAVDFNTGFQDAFQRQISNEFSTMGPSPAHSTPTSSKSHYNSSEKFAHQAGFSNDKYYQASNNNFNQQNSSKIKTLPQQQSAGHLPKQPQK